MLDLKDKIVDDIIKNMDGFRKRNMKKVKKNGVKVRFLFEEELLIFRLFMEDMLELKVFVDCDDKFYYNCLKYYKDCVLVFLVYINFDEYIKELNEECDILNKDLNKVLKDIEKCFENKKVYNKWDNL